MEVFDATTTQRTQYTEEDLDTNTGRAQRGGSAGFWMDNVFAISGV